VHRPTLLQERSPPGADSPCVISTNAGRHLFFAAERVARLGSRYHQAVLENHPEGYRISAELAEFAQGASASLDRWRRHWNCRPSLMNRSAISLSPANQSSSSWPGANQLNVNVDDIVNAQVPMDYTLKLPFGITGRIVKLMRLSARSALRKSSRSLTIEHLQEAGKQFAADLGLERQYP
jgi:hypothetical protein